MEVGSVSSSLYTSTQNVQAQARTRQPEQAEQDPQALQSQPSQQTAQSEQARPAQNASESESTVSAQVEAERNRPTVNLNGQLVGTRVNTTA